MVPIPYISAILLAAGASRRMGSFNKLLLPFGGQTVVETVADHLLLSLAREVIVVTGYEAEHVGGFLRKRPLLIVHNPDFDKGMTSSIQAGIRAAQPHTQGFLIALGDMPLIRPDEYNHIIAAFAEACQQSTDAIVIPEFEGRRGNPALFSASLREALLTHADPEGCKGVIQKYAKSAFTCTMHSPNVTRDMDCYEDYLEMCKNKP